MIVTVKAPICNVIRMGLTPFPGMWLTARRLVQRHGQNIIKFDKKQERRLPIRAAPLSIYIGFKIGVPFAFA